ncbi:Scr1 family TA system antitoxin-like transcriptional regulator [Streptomyces sp. NPDC008139]|uniref:helix-turn-helix domain-containing protein n=1 Tax=Streptomyces sp. NPDC008139 TaxID=3364814 RepID=UPI0036EAEFB9
MADGMDGAGEAETSAGTGAGTPGSEPETSDSLRTFGAFVQALREHARLSREEFGNQVRFSKHTIASIEQGRRMPDADFVDRAEPVLGNTGALRKAHQHLGRQRGLASWFRQWARLEKSAITLYTYECRMIPGLLQTEAYAQTMFADLLPPLSDEQMEAQWAERAKRKRLLTERPNTAFSFVLDEHLFLRRTGGVDVTRELIDHILDLSQRRNIEIQILPLSTGVHSGLIGPIVMQETPDNRWLAYGEGQETGQLISDPKVVSILQQRYAKLRAQALTPEDTRSLLERFRGEL